jgi:hypothetical protein
MNSITYPKIDAIHPIINALLFVIKIKFNEVPLSYGTGSYPPSAKGLHLSILFIVSHNPFQAPYFSSASMAYWEHVGV